MSLPSISRRTLMQGAAGAAALSALHVSGVIAQDTPPAATPIPLPADAAENQEFRLAATSAAVRLDPHFGYSVYQIGTFVYPLWAGLTKMDADLNVVGDIALSWDVSDDGTSYTFHLDPNRAFADGTPITAQDVVWSWTRSLNPATQSLVAGGYLQTVVGAQDYWLGKTPDPPTSYRAVDDHTFQVDLIGPRNFFPKVLVHPSTFVVKGSEVEAGTADNPWYLSAKAFSGPYVISSYEEGQSLELTPNAYYPTAPLIQKISYRLVDDTQTQFLLYQNDEVDFTSLAEPDADNIKNTDDTYRAELIEQPQWWSGNLYMRNGLAPFEDANVRRAFAQSINKEAILSAVLKNLHQDIQGIYYPGMNVFNDSLVGASYDSAAAKAALAASTYGSADKLPAITIWSTEEDQAATPGRVIAAMQEMWRQELGVEVEVQIIASYEDMLKSSVQLVIGEEALHYPDASGIGYFQCDSGANISQFCDPQIDANYNTAGETQDQAESVSLYQSIETDLMGRVAFHPLYQRTGYLVLKPRVKNFKSTAMYTFPDFDKVYIANT